MANTQRIICTAVPAGLTVDADDIPVSVLVAPRLQGEDHLGAYPDWVNWPQHLLDGRPTVTFECAGETRTVELDTGALQPAHWAALFTERTFVRTHAFDDYSGEFVASYDTRTAHALVQATYQAVGLEFAVPTAEDDPREQRNRSRFRGLLGGFALGWDEESGRAWRRGQAAAQRQAEARELTAPASSLGLTSAGLVATGGFEPGSPGFGTAQTAALQEWGVFTHQPQGAAVSREALDANRFDFHQALSAVHAHRVLQRSLGLVFDLTLPADFLPDTGDDGYAELRVVAFDAAWDADLTTAVPVTSTAYVHAVADGGRRLFAVAPLATVRKQSGRPRVLGLQQLDPRWFGVTQLDVDGAVHKTVQQAENLVRLPGFLPARHPEVFDPYTTVSALRSGGLSLFADSRALGLVDTFNRSKEHSDDLEAGVPQRSPFCAEDLTRGYRLDIWDSVTRDWHSLHRIDSTLHLGAEQLEVTDADTEGFVQTAVTQAAPEADGTRANTDLHLHESIARWAGWSLSASTVGVHLTRHGDPDKALPDPADPDPDDLPVTEFALTSTAHHVVGTLPRLRFGVGYRLRLRRVDLADNGLRLDDEGTALATPTFSLPRRDDEVPYLRFEPVGAPVVVARGVGAVTGRGSDVERLVVRTANADPSLDTAAADLTDSDRHIAPPGVHVELAERHGMLDGPDGRLNRSPAMWTLIGARDAGAFPTVAVPELGTDDTGATRSIAVEAADDPALPYLPDPLARAAALRDLPGTAGRTRGRVRPDDPAAGPVAYEKLTDPQARAGTVTVVEFGGRDDWQEARPFRLALADGNTPPQWDPQQRVLTLALPKGTTHVVRLSSCPDSRDLELLGVWGWLREYVEWGSVHRPDTEFFQRPGVRDRIAHVLQLAAEGGHGMLTPPRLLTLVHAVQQPIGRPAFTRLPAQLSGRTTLYGGLQTEPETFPTASSELAVITAWRELDSTDAYLVGAIQVHGASTAKVDVTARWTDPVDDPAADPPADPGEQDFSVAVDELPLPVPREGALIADGEDRDVGWYDADHDLIAFAPRGAQLGNRAEGAELYDDAAPRHRVGDTKHHVVHYTAVATSRYREYFPPSDDPDAFLRRSDPVEVHVPASARPLAPSIRYVLPTFGWERVATGTQVRSVRTGGGLRVYLDRPWFSSGVGELLGVSLATPQLWSTERERLKPWITQWGQDPIWQTEPLDRFPDIENFPDATAWERELHLGDRSPGPVAVAGHPVAWDAERKLWFCDLTVATGTTTYAPFVRLALVRYQPHALVAAKLSRVVLADFAQLTPERALTVTASPFEPGELTVTVSGPAATGPVPQFLGRPLADRPASVSVSVQERDPSVSSDLAWTRSTAFETVPAAGPTDPLIRWQGRVRWAGDGVPEPDRYRLLVTESEVFPADRPARRRLDGDLFRPAVGNRLVYAETVPLDPALLARPPYPAASTTI